MLTRFKTMTLGRFQKASLKRKVTIIIFSTVAIILVFCCTVFSYAIHYNNKNATKQFLYSSYLQKNDTLNAYMEKIDYSAYTIMFSNWAQQFLMIDQSVSPGEQQIYRRNISHFLNSLASANNDITFVLLSANTIVFSNNNSQYYDMNYNIEEQPWFPQLLQEKKYVEYGSSELFARWVDDWSMTIYYPVTSYYDFSVIGYLAINIPADNLSFLINSTANESIIVTNHDEKAFLSHMTFGTADPASIPGVVAYTGRMMNGDWTIQIFQQNNLNPLAELGSYNLSFLLLIPIILMFILIDLWFSSYLTKPIVDCKNALLEIRNNHFGVTVENHYHDEISELIDGLNEMSSALVTLLRQNEKMDKLRRDAEFEMLQQKVNPHFLYNTLEIINSMILSGKNSEAIHVCETLGKIYHYNLTNYKWVTIRDEYEYVKRYLQITQYKADDFTILGDIDEEALDIHILKLILQPLVENSIKHGFRAKHADCCLTISIRSLSEMVEILIMDNGSGIPPEILAQIEDTIKRVRGGYLEINNLHIGIRNVYQRLFLEFGSKFKFTMESRQNFGTKTIIQIPKNRLMNRATTPLL